MSDYPATPWGDLQRLKDKQAGVGESKPKAKKKASKKKKGASKAE